MLGAWDMAGEDDGRMIEVSVGSGMSDAERVEFWANRDQMVGTLGEVRADALTKERDSDTWSLRFPRWKGRRGFEPGEKL